MDEEVKPQHLKINSYKISTSTDFGSGSLELSMDSYQAAGVEHDANIAGPACCR